MALSFAQQYTLLLIGFVGTMIISRLLTPTEIGIFSVGAVLVGVAQVIRDFGVGQYLIQEKELTTEKIRAAFTLTLLIAWGVAAILALVSAPVANFYKEPNVRPVLLVLAVNCLLIPFGSVTMPYLRRQMRFGAIYWINVVSNLANFLVSITLALLGFGFMSLAWAAVAGTAMAVLMSLPFRPKELPWRPGFSGMSKVLSFGSYATGASIVDEMGDAAPDLIIGKMISMEGVGIFSKAQGVLGIFNRLITSAITPVIFPLYSAHARGGHDLKKAYLKTMSYMTALSWPFFVFLGLMAFPVVRVLYGDQWDAAVPLVRIMCFSAAVYSMFSMARYLFVAMGHVKKQAHLDTISVPVRILGILLAAPFGLVAVAWGIVLTTLFRSFMSYRYLASLTGMRLGELVRSISRSFVLTSLSAVVPMIVIFSMQIGPGHLLLPLAIAAAGTAIFWALGIFILNHEIKNEFEMAVRKVLSLRGARAANVD